MNEACLNPKFTIPKMLKASSLFYAVVISLVIAILSSALIMYAYLVQQQMNFEEVNERLNLNANSGFTLLLNKQSIVDINSEVTTDLFQTEQDSVILSRKSWGAYEVVRSMAFTNNRYAVRLALIGTNVSVFQNYSIFLSDNNKPLMVAGKNVIRGNAFLPKAGVKSAYVDGRSFEGKTQIEGELKNSTAILPDIDDMLMKYISSVFETKQLSDADSTIELESALNSDSLYNSFENKTLLVYSNGPILISSGYFYGNIAFVSPVSIKITENAHLKEVQLYAPQIEFENGVVGEMQAFARDTIFVRENVKLNYPSVLGLLQTKKSIDFASILISKGDTIEGDVFSYKEKIGTQNKRSVITIKKEATVYGQVFACDIAEHQGTILGSLTCNKILLTTPSSIYENHLLDATIDETRRSVYFVGANLLESSSLKKVAKWLR